MGEVDKVSFGGAANTVGMVNGWLGDRRGSDWKMPEAGGAMAVSSKDDSVLIHDADLVLVKLDSVASIADGSYGNEGMG